MKSPEILRQVSVDCVIFGYEDSRLKVLLRRELIEHDDKTTIEWKLPGNHVLMSESVEETAVRTLKEQTGINIGNVFLKQFKVFSSTDRLHRREFDFLWIQQKGVGEWRVITIAFYAVVNIKDIDSHEMSPEAHWRDLHEVGELIFDHRDILNHALEKLRLDVAYEPVIFELLPDKFALSELQRLYELVMDQRIDKRNFRRKVSKLKYLVPLAERQTNVPHKAATLYQFNRKIFDKNQKEQTLF